MSREKFLARVHEASERGRQFRVHSRPFPSDAGYLGAGNDLVGRFAAEVLAVGGRAHVVASRDEARARLLDLLDQSSAQSALCWECELFERLGLAELLASRNCERLDYSGLVGIDVSEQRRRMLAAGIGIGGATWAVAETGSVVVASGPGSERLASLLPPFYVTVLEQNQLLPDLFDLFAKYDLANGGKLPSNLAFITGPSKTGDIELRLTTGVHGPGVWHVIVLPN